MTTRKLRNGPVIEVDDQIIRWRQKMRREGIRLGRAAERAARKNRGQNRAAKDEADIVSGKKKFF